LQSHNQFYRNHTRCFRLQGSVGPVFQTCSLIQGCAFSLLMVNSCFALLALRTAKVAPEVKISMFVDDCKMRVLVSRLPQLSLALREGRAFDDLTGQQLNSDKCVLICADRKVAALVASEVLFDGIVQVCARSLGFGVNYGMRMNRTLQNKRVQEAAEVMRLVAKLPKSKMLRVKVAQTLAITKLPYGAIMTLPSDSQLYKLRTLVLKTVFSVRRSMREPNVVLALVYETHRLDPKSSVVYACVRGLRRIFLTKPAMCDVGRTIWEELTGKRIPGPMQAFRECLDYLGWTCAGALWTLTRTNDVPITLLDPNTGFFSHELRRSLRWRLLASVPARHDLTGIAGEHISYAACAVLLRDKMPKEVQRAIRPVLEVLGGKPDSRRQGTISTVISGAIMSADRLMAAGLVDTSICPCCDACKESPLHVFCECPAHDSIRALLPMSASPADPACFSCCGLMPELQWVQDQRRELASRPAHEHECGPDRFVACINEAWTDGSCLRQALPEIRRAGYAVFFAHDHPMNVSCLLPGLDQNSVRAEAVAVLTAFKLVMKPITVYCDCAPVVNLARRLLTNPDTDVWQWQNADVWLAVRECIRNGCHGSSVVKVASHTVLRTDASEEERRIHEGNRQADTLAVEGARMHSLSDDLVKAYYDHLRRVATRQAMLSLIIDHRWQLLRDKGFKDGGGDEAHDADSVVVFLLPAPGNRPCEDAVASTVSQTEPADILVAIPDAVSMRVQCDAGTSIWRFTPECIYAVRHYFSGLCWQQGAAITLLEVMVDFISFTGVEPRFARSQRPGLVASMYNAFVPLLAASARMLGIPSLLPAGAKFVRLDSLTKFTLASRALGLNFRPRLRCPDAVSSFLNTVARNDACQSDVRFPYEFDKPAVPEAWFRSYDSPGNFMRELFGLPPCIRVHTSDNTRLDKISSHNSIAMNMTPRRHYVDVDMPDPDAYPNVPVHAVWPSKARLSCSTCHKSVPITKMREFLLQKCGADPGELAL
jgi:ribonuclease HI